jgi:hypothetical protein
MATVYRDTMMQPVFGYKDPAAAAAGAARGDRASVHAHGPAALAASGFSVRQGVAAHTILSLAASWLSRSSGLLGRPAGR